VNVDRAVRWGFSHELGPFEIWDALGVRETVADMERQKISVAPWVKEMLASGHETFYRSEDGRLNYYDPARKSYHRVDTTEPIADKVLCLELLTSTLDADALTSLRDALDTIENGDYAGLVIANQAADFCIGSDLGVKELQDVLMRVRFSSKPVVVAPAGKTLGVGTVLSMSAAATVAAAETYMGQVGVAGSKEMVRRVVSPAMKTANTDPLPLLQHVLQTIVTGKVSTSAAEARSLGFLAASDLIVMNRDHQIESAKRVVLELVDAGYSPPTRGKTCYAAGRDVLAALRTGLFVMRQGEFMTESDSQAANKVAFVLCGGDISVGQWVDEQYFLDLERRQ
jgi:3-hydroxyacyl-CoA dehydrogenase